MRLKVLKFHSSCLSPSQILSAMSQMKNQCNENTRNKRVIGTINYGRHPTKNRQLSCDDAQIRGKSLSPCRNQSIDHVILHSTKIRVESVELRT